MQLSLRVATSSTSSRSAGVILLSEETHRVAYNLAFKEFNVVPKGEGDIAEWSVKYYEVLQNSVGGGKPKMHHFFSRSPPVCRIRVVLSAWHRLNA